MQRIVSMLFDETLLTPQGTMGAVLAAVPRERLNTARTALPKPPPTLQSQTFVQILVAVFVHPGF